MKVMVTDRRSGVPKLLIGKSMRISGVFYIQDRGHC